jgi:hypothetical protein
MSPGWTSQDLTVTDDENLWTVADAARLMGPLPGDPPDTPLKTTMQKLRDHTRLYPRRFSAVGKRRTTPAGHPGRYARVYAADDFIRLYEEMGEDRQSTAA